MRRLHACFLTIAAAALAAPAAPALAQSTGYAQQLAAIYGQPSGGQPRVIHAQTLHAPDVKPRLHAADVNRQRPADPVHVDRHPSIDRFNTAAAYDGRVSRDERRSHLSVGGSYEDSGRSRGYSAGVYVSGGYTHTRGDYAQRTYVHPGVTKVVHKKVYYDVRPPMVYYSRPYCPPPVVHVRPTYRYVCPPPVVYRPVYRPSCGSGTSFGFHFVYRD